MFSIYTILRLCILLPWPTYHPLQNLGVCSSGPENSFPCPKTMQHWCTTRNKVIQHKQPKHKYMQFLLVLIFSTFPSNICRKKQMHTMPFQTKPCTVIMHANPSYILLFVAHYIFHHFIWVLKRMTIICQSTRFKMTV